KLLLLNTNNKDIFSSFDHLSEITRDTNSLAVKTIIVDIYMLFNGVKKSLIDNYIDFADYFPFVVSLRPILIDFLLNKYNNAELMLADLEKIIVQILKDG